MDAAKPLYDLSKRSVKWLWSKECEDAFLTLENKLVISPILAYPDEKGDEFVLNCNTSSTRIGTVLSQQ